MVVLEKKHERILIHLMRHTIVVLQKTQEVSGMKKFQDIGIDLLNPSSIMWVLYQCLEI